MRKQLEIDINIDEVDKQQNKDLNINKSGSNNDSIKTNK